MVAGQNVSIIASPKRLSLFRNCYLSQIVFNFAFETHNMQTRSYNLLPMQQSQHSNLAAQIAGDTEKEVFYDRQVTQLKSTQKKVVTFEKQVDLLNRWY